MIVRRNADLNADAIVIVMNAMTVLTMASCVCVYLFGYIWIMSLAFCTRFLGGIILEFLGILTKSVINIRKFASLF